LFVGGLPRHRGAVAVVGRIADAEPSGGGERPAVLGGLTPTMARNRSRKVVGAPKPTKAEMRSALRSLVSSKACARARVSRTPRRPSKS